jgi:hypothetical protein
MRPFLSRYFCTAALSLTLLGVASVPSIAQAAPPAEPASDDASAKALARFRRGQEFYNERNFAAALVEFRKAYETAPNYRVQFNIGQVCYQMQDYVCAQAAFTQYLTGGGADIPEARRQAVEQELQGLRQRVGSLDLTVDVAGAEVSVDDVVIGTTPVAEAVPLSAGRHKLVVVKSGFVSVTRSFDLAGQDVAHLKLTLPPITASGPVAPTPSVPQPPPTEKPKSNESSMTPLSWLGYGLGIGMLVGGSVTGSMALGANSDVKEKVYGNEADAKADRDRVTVLGITTDALIAGGVVTLAVTTILTFVVSRDGSKRASALSFKPAGASLAF